MREMRSDLDQGVRQPAGAVADPAILVQRGIAAQRGGHVVEAERLYDEALRIDPAHVDALHLLGVCRCQLGRLQEALALFERALALRPGWGIALANLGNALQALQRFEEALHCFDRALEAMGKNADLLFNRGNLLQRMMRHAEAIGAYDAALALRPNFPEAMRNRSLARLAGIDDAIACEPSNAKWHHDRGAVLLQLQRMDEGLASYAQAIALAPDRADIRSNRGCALIELGRLEDAVADLRIAVDLAPDRAEAHGNLGLALHLLDRDDEAIACFARALQRDTGYWQAYANRALVFEKLGRHGLALADLDHALALRPDDPQIRFNAAVCRLRTGDFAGGWPHFEARRRLAARRVARLHDEARLWLGADDISGKTLLLHAEHGLGDTIQFCRYAPLAAARGARVWIEAPPTLLPLLQTLRGVERVVAQAEATYDRHTPMLSLPLAFGTAADSIPGAVPYLAPPADRLARWNPLLGPRSGRPRIGLAWSGHRSTMNDRDRSIPLASLLPLAAFDAQWYSLQVEVREADADALHEAKRTMALRDVREFLGDMADTAALVAQLDLVISVDTSVAHLAGAMGRPLWLLLPSPAEWRWLTDRTDSPWYPTARLFRQERRGQWSGVVAAVLDALRQAHAS